MVNQNSIYSIGLAIFLELSLIITSFINITSRQWQNALLTLLAIGCLILPFLITHLANKNKIVLPCSFQITTLILIFMAQYLGEIRKFYQIFWWWDLLLHALFGSYTVIIALYLIKGIIRKEQETTNQRFKLYVIIFGFCFSITIGTLWEMFEFIGDWLFKTKMIKGGLADTSTDLITNILAALITSFIYYNYELSK